MKNAMRRFATQCHSVLLMNVKLQKLKSTTNQNLSIFSVLSDHLVLVYFIIKQNQFEKNNEYIYLL